MKMSVLVIDDEATFCLHAEEALSCEGYDVRTVGSLMRARAAIAAEAPDVVILDRRLPDGDGIDFLRELRDDATAICAVVVTAHGDVGNAVQALQSGAADYLTKPLGATDLVIKLRKILETRALRDRLALAHSSAGSLPRVEPISRGKRLVLERLEAAATSPQTPVLITGASGVGKQYAAELLHKLTYSERPDAPFVEVNCATLPPDNVEAELFGQESGVWGETRLTRRGLIEIADGGTLFLDEICEMPLRLQSKLLKFLDNWRFRRMGSQREMVASLRVVAASNRDLTAMVRDGKFREDLYHRMAVFWVNVPPLADGPEDIPPLTDAFVGYFAGRIKKRIKGLTEGARRALLAYDYPGNVRELRNLIERAVILAKGAQISEADVVLPERHVARPRREPFFAVELDRNNVPLPLEHVERQYVARLLMHFKGHRTAAAEALGISYPTFLKRLRELGMGDDSAAAASHG